MGKGVNFFYPFTPKKRLHKKMFFQFVSEESRFFWKKGKWFLPPNPRNFPLTLLPLFLTYPGLSPYPFYAKKPRGKSRFGLFLVS